MKRIISPLIILLFCASYLHGQEIQIANKYFKAGEFEKAYTYFKKGYDKSPQTYILKKIVECKQQLKDYKKCRMLLENHSKRYPSPEINVILGYNYQLEKRQSHAKIQYEKAISGVKKNPGYAYSTAQIFEDYSLQRYALRTYQIGMATNPDFNFDYLIGKIYGELADYPNMFSHYLDYVEKNTVSKPNIIMIIKGFLSKDAENENNKQFKKQLLLRSQKSTNPIWNSMLSWLFTLERDYKKAFAQSKAIYLKKGLLGDLDSIFQLGISARENNDIENAIVIFKYLTEQISIPLQIKAHLQLLDIDTKKGEKPSSIDNKYKRLISRYGSSDQTLDLSISYSRFLAYTKDTPEEAIDLLQNTLKTSKNSNSIARLKILLGDIMVYSGHYDKGLIYYAQVQNEMKNSSLGQKAFFKVAQTAFFRGDFLWADSQLDILKSASSQSIANDALKLKWIITDNNSAKDSTKIALKLYAKASLYSLQNKTDKALSVLDSILTVYEKEPIEDDVLLKKAEILERKKHYKLAAANYQKIVDSFSEDVYGDDAAYLLAKLYDNHLNNPNKAKEFYARIIDYYPNSIYYVTSRKRYRLLRGDKTDNL